LHIKKVLIIRYNSIGDIVLTSPVISLLYSNQYEVHYLCKKAYSSLVANNPKVDRVWEFDDNFSILIPQLKAEGFIYIIDLHNNYRSGRIKKALGAKSYTLCKSRIKLYLMTRWRLDLSPEKHIVDRFLDTIEDIVTIENTPLEFYIPDRDIENAKKLLPTKSYVAIAVGAAFHTKQIPEDMIIDVIDEIQGTVVLLGGIGDVEKSKIIEIRSDRKVYNLTGQLSIEESAHAVQQSRMLLTGDTGLMHIAAAVGTKVVAIFGSTHPKLGYTPYMQNDSDAIVMGNQDLSCRPCTKQGNHSCPKGHFRCMLELDTDDIVDNINRFID